MKTTELFKDCLNKLKGLICFCMRSITEMCQFSNKGNYKQGEKTALRLGENNSK